MTIWYVDSNIGNDTNSGLTPAAAFLTIQHAHDQTVAGDTVYIMPGKGYGGGTGVGALLTISRSGSAGGGYITYSGYPGLPMPIINAPTDQTFVVCFASTFAFTTAVVPSYITLKGLEIVGRLQALTYQGAWNDASAGTYSQPYNSSAITTGALMYPPYGTPSLANASSTTTLNLQYDPTPAGVKAGDFVVDATVSSRIPSATTVVSLGALSVVVSSTVSVLTGDTINFFRPPHHIQIIDCKIHDFSGSAAQWELTDYITMTGNLIYNTAWYGGNAYSGVSVYNSVDVDTNTSSYKNLINENIFFNNICKIPWGRNTWDASVITSATTNSQTLTSSNQLHFASTTGIVVGMAVFDTAGGHNGYIAAGTYVTVVNSGTLVTISANPLTTIPTSETMKFVKWSDGEGLIIDDLYGDQESKRPYGGRTGVINNLAILNGSCGLLNFDSQNVDMLFNTSYLNMNSAPYRLQQGGATPDMAISDDGTTGRATGNVFNNIVYSRSDIIPLKDNTTGATATCGNNLTYGNATTPPGSNNQVNVNPLFVNPTTDPLVIGALTPSTMSTFTNFQLQPGSPAIDAGNGSYTRSTDFLGNAGLFGPAYDMGAYESPCSPWNGNQIQSMATIMQTLLADNINGDISALDLREALITVWAGRSPYPR